MAEDVLIQPNGRFRLGDFLTKSLVDTKWTEFRAAVAFVKYSGTKHIRRGLMDIANRGKVKISVGIDAGGTSVEGLTDLLESLDNHGEIWVFHNANNSTFHPKIFLFKNEHSAEAVIGSGNLTEGGLYTNYEAGMRLSLNRANEADSAVLATIEAALDEWSQPQEGLCYPLDANFLTQLTDRENVPTEAQAWETEEKSQTPSRASNNTPIFKRIAVPRAPSIARELPPDLPEEATQEDNEDIIVEVAPPSAPQTGKFTAFIMTLQRTDVGTGQITKGTSRRSPEIFIPLAARDADPDFWGWPAQFIADTTKPGKMDRSGVRVRIGTNIVDVNMMTWPDKHDFRLRSEHLRSAGNIGDIMYMERSDGKSGFTYYVEVIPLGSTRHSHYLALCVNAVRNSKRLWGYV